MIKIAALVFLGILVLASFITFILFGKDKKMAKSNGGPERIKEKTLLSMCSLGGAIGGFIGRLVFHHKTEKKYFSFTIYLGMLLQIGTLALLMFLWLRG